jgi:hypothetical protein
MGSMPMFLRTFEREHKFMKRIILVGVLVLLGACGSSNGGVSVGTGTGSTLAPAAGSDDTISVDNFGDMPKPCIDLLAAFLKKIEPTVSKIDWDKATMAEFQAFGQQFQTEADSFDTQTEAAGCNKYNLTGSDDAQFQQMTELAKAEAPGTLGFLGFLKALSVAATANAGSIPTDCAGTIAAIEPYLGEGKSVKDLTVAEVTLVGQLMSGVQDNCTDEEAAAFYARADVTAFVGS